MFTKKLTNTILVSILLIAAFLRLWNLSGLPSALSPDEASLGYNAYSILKTGRDEYGKILPIVFKSFGDYKPGLYVYLSIPFVAILGLTELAVRLPSALAGVFSVYLIFLISQKLVDKKKDNGVVPTVIGLCWSLMLAISPWHIFFSRGAWEANISLTLALLGSYLFLKGLENSRYFLYSLVSFALTLITYQGAKLSSLILAAVLVFTFKDQLITAFTKNKKPFIYGTLVSLFIALPIILSLFQGQTGRLKVFSVFSYPRPVEYTTSFLNEGGEKIGDLNYYIFHSESLNFARGIMGRWFNHFSAKFLFFEGDYQNPRHSAPNSGMLLLFELILIPAGIYSLIKSGNKKLTMLILSWLVLSPLPAVLSRDQVQSVRALNMVIPLVMISGYGLNYLIGILSHTKLQVAGYLVILLALGLSVTNFVDSYFIHYNVHNAKYLSYGYKEVVHDVIASGSKYQKIVVQQSYSQPYIYFLFYGSSLDKENFNPRKYQQEASLQDGGIDVGLVEKINNIEFVNFSWPYATGEKGTLLIGNDVAVPPAFSSDSYNLVKEIKYPDGFMNAFRMVETK